MRSIKIILVTLLFFSCNKRKENLPAYRQEMRDFVQGISSYAKTVKPGFIVIAQNGHQLVFEGEAGNESSVKAGSYLSAVDGLGREDLFYGYNADNDPTSHEEKMGMITHLNAAKSQGLKVLVTDYCSDPQKMSDSYMQNYNNGFISFAADQRDLDNIPSYPVQPNNSNGDTISSLSQAKNFLYLINAGRYSSRTDFLAAVAATSYDAIIIDHAFNDGSAFSIQEIAALRLKPNGAPRLVICYMSIGEAENYRYYWKDFWNTNPPSFIAAENMEWNGNYKVRYWEKDWQNIIYGNDNSFTRRIINQGFDGIYLDIIDGFEYFEDINHL